MNSKANIKKGNKSHSRQELSPQRKKQAQGDKWFWLALAVVMLTTFVVYFKAISFGLLQVWDDQVYITENSHIHNFNWENIKLIFSSFYVNNYQPVSMLFYALEYKIGAGHAALFHFDNILLHLANTVLVFILIRKISSDNKLVALITAAFFAIHPMHVESVAWVAERKDVLYTFFFLISIIYYCGYLKTEKFRPIILCFVFFMLSCLSKSAGVILPLVMLLIDYYFHRKLRWKMIIEKLPFLIISVILGIVAMQSQKQAVQNMAPDMSFIEHISVVSYSFIMYLVKAVVPFKLSAIYPYPAGLGGTLPVIYYISVFLAGLILFLIGYSNKLGKDIIFGFTFFIITIVLVLQIVPVGAASMADRYTYVPYIGLFFIAGKLMDYLFNNKDARLRNYKNYLVFLLVAGFVSYSAISYARVGKWENDEILFTDAKYKFPYCDVPYFIIGDYCLTQYKANSENRNKSVEFLNRAISEYENALKHAFNDADKVKAYYNLGTAKGYLGDFSGAKTEYDKVLAIDKNYVNAYINRGNARRELKDYRGSIEDFNKVIEISPENPLGYSNRGVTKFQTGDYKGAIEDFNLTIQVDSGNFKAYNDRGSAKYMLKDYNGALEDYNKAVALNPKYTDAVNNRDMVMKVIESLKK